MDHSLLSISDIALNHYLPAKRQRRRTNTVDGYESSIRLHVLPRWEGLSIPEIGPDDVQAWVDELAEKIGAGGAWKAYKCLRQVVRWAMDKWGLFVADPTRGIEQPRKPVYRPETLTHRRLKRLIRGMVGCECEPTLIIEAALGTRPGEDYYIRWERINWRTGHVPIDGTLQQTSKGLEEFPTKTAKGERDGYLPPWALDRLHQIWVERGRPKGRVIGDLTPSQVVYRIQKWIRRNKLPRITMKNLRHTWGTIAAQAGVKIEDVAAMMGHSNIQTTYRYYYALDAARSKRAQKRVARRILGKTSDDMYKGILLKPAWPQALPQAA